VKADSFISVRQRPFGAWENVGTAIEPETTLVGQAKGKELGYSVRPGKT